MGNLIYVYSYIVFALVYVVAGTIFSVRTFKASNHLARQRRALRATNDEGGLVVFDEQRAWRMIDHAQLATLLPLAYVVCSIFLGSLILKGNGSAALANTIWVLVTILATLAVLALLLRDPGRHTPAEPLRETFATSDPAVHRRIATRLGFSAALLTFITAFMALNAWAVLTNMQQLLQMHYVL